jgi:ParB family chromosome partitioning protein
VQRLGWPKIPAVVKEADDQTLLTLALIENLQRDDLSPIDEAAGYQRLTEEFQLAQAEVARLVGRDRSTVANLLRLLRLPEPIKALIQDGKLSEGHARALLAVSDESAMIGLAQEVVDGGWSVRELENRTRDQSSASRPTGTPEEPPEPRARSAQKMPTADVRRVEDALRKRLGTDVRVTARRRGRGFLSISYYSNDDLARVLELILGEPFAG